MNKNSASVLLGLVGLGLAKQKFGSSARKSNKFIKMRINFDLIISNEDFSATSPSSQEILDYADGLFYSTIPEHQKGSDAWRKRYRGIDGFNKLTSDIAKMCHELDLYCEAGLDNLDPDELEWLFQEISEKVKSLNPLGNFSEYIGWSGNIGDGTPLGVWKGLSSDFSDALSLPSNIIEGVAFDKNSFFGSVTGCGITLIQPQHHIEEFDYDDQDRPIFPPEWVQSEGDYGDEGAIIGSAYIDFHFNVPKSVEHTPLLFVKVREKVDRFLDLFFAPEREGFFTRETLLNWCYKTTSVQIDDNLDIPHNIRMMFNVAKERPSELRKF
jgi:hypothetical protein